MHLATAAGRRAVYLLAALHVAVVAGAVLSAASPQTQTPPTTVAADGARQILNQYCIACHNAQAKTDATQSGVVLDTADRRFRNGLTSVGEYLEARKDYNEVVQKYRDALVRHRRSMLDLNTAVGARVLP